MSANTVKLESLLRVSLGQKLGQLRAIPVRLNSEEKYFLLTYGADFDVDPSVNMFYYPTDTLKMALISEKGEFVWKRELGRSVVPGIWFCPVFAFDLDGDGMDEIWYVNNLNENHPLAVSFYRLERLDPRTGETTGQWQWPNDGGKVQPLSCTFRNFILGGYVHGEPVLVTAQGTYDDMYIQCWNSDMKHRWTKHIPVDVPGARGSHITPVIDLNRDGVDELLWGERCIELDKGVELFCADRDVYRGHSDVILPILDRSNDRWHIYTVRETDPDATPRVVLFNDQGDRVWGDVDYGHIDIGWAARIGEDMSHVVMAIRVDGKTCGPDGRFHASIEEFTFDALTGNPHPLPYSVYRTIPVDVNGDGYHELVRGMPNGDGELIDRFGNSLGNIGGTVAMSYQMLDHPGEQILSFSPDGIVNIWADRNAEDSPEAKQRYEDPYYQRCISLYAVGYNLYLSGGL